MSEEEKTTKIKEPLTSISDRIIATIIDFLIVDAIFIICLVLPFAFQLSFVLKSIRVLEILMYIFWPLMGVVAGLASTAYFVYWPLKTNGLTIGKKAMGIRLMIISDNQKGDLRYITQDDLVLSIKRVLFSFVDMQLFGGLGMIFMNKSPITQTFADEKLDTVVVDSEELSKEALAKKIAEQQPDTKEAEVDKSSKKKKDKAKESKTVKEKKVKEKKKDKLDEAKEEKNE